MSPGRADRVDLLVAADRGRPAGLAGRPAGGGRRARQLEPRPPPPRLHTAGSPAGRVFDRGLSGRPRALGGGAARRPEGPARPGRAGRRRAGWRPTPTTCGLPAPRSSGRWRACWTGSGPASWPWPPAADAGQRPDQLAVVRTGRRQPPGQHRGVAVDGQRRVVGGAGAAASAAAGSAGPGRGHVAPAVRPVDLHPVWLVPDQPLARAGRPSSVACTCSGGRRQGLARAGRLVAGPRRMSTVSHSSIPSAATAGVDAGRPPGGQPGVGRVDQRLVAHPAAPRSGRRPRPPNAHTGSWPASPTAAMSLPRARGQPVGLAGGLGGEPAVGHRAERDGSAARVRDDGRRPAVRPADVDGQLAQRPVRAGRDRPGQVARRRPGRRWPPCRPRSARSTRAAVGAGRASCVIGSGSGGARRRRQPTAARGGPGGIGAHGRNRAARRLRSVNHVPLSVLDLSPVAAGTTAGQALRQTTQLARRAEELGYRGSGWPSTTTRRRSPAPRPRC